MHCGAIANPSSFLPGFSELEYHLGYCIDLAMRGDVLYWIEKVDREDVVHFINVTERINQGQSELHLLYSTTENLYSLTIVDPNYRKNGKCRISLLSSNPIILYILILI